MNESQRQQLDELGFVVLENHIDPTWLRELQRATEAQFQLEGDQAGIEFKQEPGSRRLANLVNKGDSFRRIISDPMLLEGVQHVLGEKFKLSSLNARSANPRNESSQPLHADMGAVADDSGFWVCNSVWMLDDFTTENGALRVIPRSHQFQSLPQDALDDVHAAHPDEELITGPAGTVVIMNAHAWHGGTANKTDKPRTAIHAFFARCDKPQQQYQKQLLSEELQQNLTALERKILALDDCFNDKVSAGDMQRSGFLK